MEPAAEDADEDSSDHSSSPESSDDDQLVRKLNDDHRVFLSRTGRPARSAPTSSRVSTGSMSTGKLPHVMLSSSKGGRLPSSGVKIPQVLTTTARGPDSPDSPVNADVDATPNAKPVPRVKAAKKTATHDSPQDYSDDDSNDMRSDARTETTGSFPSSVPLTHAREYKRSKLEFTPARGTRAEAHVRSERAANAKSKEKAKAK